MRRTSAMMGMIAIRADPPHVMVMSRLRRAGIALITDNLDAVLAELAIHRGLPFADLADAVAKRIEHLGMVAQIQRLDKFDLGKETSDCVGLRVDAFDQDAGKQEIGKQDDAAEVEPRGAGQSRVDARMGNTAERDFGPAEPHSLP